jgi:hypothetical protein
MMRKAQILGLLVSHYSTGTPPLDSISIDIDIGVSSMGFP